MGNQGNLERLDKAIAAQTAYSRKDVHKLMSKGQVLVDGVPMRAFDSRISLEQAVVTVEGRRLHLSKYSYFMMNKPRGVVCATEDEVSPTVIDLVPEGMRRVGLFPAGRLDKETEGFVLVTNDGELAHRILSPRSHVPKTYLAMLDQAFSPELVEAFRNGVTIAPERPRERSLEKGRQGKQELDFGEEKQATGIRCLPAELEAVAGDFQKARVVVRQGMYHQVRRMFAAYGLSVVSLKREKIGGLELDPALELGACRALTAQELERITENLKEEK